MQLNYQIQLLNKTSINLIKRQINKYRTLGKEIEKQTKIN